MQFYNALFLKGTFANTGYEKNIFYYFAGYFHSNENVHITEIHCEFCFMLYLIHCFYSHLKMKYYLIF